MKTPLRLRGISFLLALVLSVGLLASCGEERKEPEDTESESMSETDSSSESLEEEGETEGGMSVVTLGQNGEPLFDIVIPGRATKTEQQLASRIASMVGKFTGKAPEITYDDMSPYRAETKSILIGDVNYPEVETALNALPFHRYGIQAIGNKLVVSGHVNYTLSLAGELLLDMIDASGQRNTQTVTLYVNEDWIEEETEMLLNYPKCPYGTKAVDIDNENKTLMLSYTGVASNEFDAYRKDVEALGYTLWQSNEIGDNRFCTYRSEEGEIHLSFYPMLTGGTLHIFTNRFFATSPIPDPQPYEKITEATLYNISFDYSQKSVADGYGMCYVITLEDGRYIVIDGGNLASAGSKAHDRLYTCLRENNRRPDGRIVIAAWFISHSHADHYGALDSFLDQYANDATLECVIANPYNPLMGQGGDRWMQTTLPSLLAKTRAKLIKPHTGQILTFCNTELEVLYTHENLYPTTMDDNNSSTVLRLRQNGHTALFTADTCKAACNLMARIYGEEIKSEIFQVNHHGHSGGTWEFYDLATYEDSYVLWTCPEEFFYYRTLGTFVEGKSIVDRSMLIPNRDLALKVGFERNFYAEGIVESMIFPPDGPITFIGPKDQTKDPTTYTLPD